MSITIQQLITSAVVISVIIVILYVSSSKDNYKTNNDQTLTKIITNVVEDTNLNDDYKARAKATLYKIVKRIEKTASKTQKKKGMSPSKPATEILRQNRQIIDRSNGKIKKVVVIGDTRYTIGKNNKILDIRKIPLETFEYSGEYGGWDINISIGEEISPPTSVSCFGQEGPNPLCPQDLPNCCYGPTNPPTGYCKEECEKDFDTFYDEYLASLLSTLGIAIITAWAAGALIGGGFLIIGIALVVLSVVLLILQALKGDSFSLSDLWDLIKTGISSIFNSAKINRPYEEDNSLNEEPVLDEISESLVIGQDDSVDNIVADDMPGSTGRKGSNAYMTVKDVASKGISKVILELTLLPGVFDRNIANPCDQRIDCSFLRRKQNETSQEHMKRLKCCLTPKTTLPTVSIEFPDAESPSELPPPPGAERDDEIICETRCHNGYPGIICRDRDSGEVVSETWQSSQNIARCCRNQCINGTWHTVCTPHEGIDSGTSCDEREPKL